MAPAGTNSGHNNVIYITIRERARKIKPIITICNLLNTLALKLKADLKKT